KNGKQLGALVGLTPVPFDSGKSQRDQGPARRATNTCVLRSSSSPGCGCVGNRRVRSASGTKSVSAGQQALAESRHRGLGAEVVNRAVAIRGARGVAGRGAGERLAPECEFDDAATRATGRGSDHVI